MRTSWTSFTPASAQDFSSSFLIGREELAIAHALETARRAGLVTPTETFDHYAFVHGLVQQMAYEDLDESRRVRLHAAAAGILAAGEPARPMAAARYFLAARPVVAANELFTPLVAGARAATEVAALDTAREMYTVALECVPSECADAASVLMPGGASNPPPSWS